MGKLKKFNRHYYHLNIDERSIVSNGKLHRNLKIVISLLPRKLFKEFKDVWSYDLHYFFSSSHRFTDGQGLYKYTENVADGLEQKHLLEILRLKSDNSKSTTT